MTGETEGKDNWRVIPDGARMRRYVERICVTAYFCVIIPKRVNSKATIPRRQLSEEKNLIKRKSHGKMGSDKNLGVRKDFM